MPIVDSMVQVEHPQRDGRRYVIETHTDQEGTVYVREYLADVGVNVNAVMAARALTLSEELAVEEVRRLLGDG